jgi:hypothetical protein
MRTTVDIPDLLYRELKSKAASEGRSVKEIILRSVESELRPAKRHNGPIRPPTIKTKRPGTLKLDNAKIYDLIDFP